MDAIVNIAQQLNETKRSELSRVLLALNTTNERSSSSEEIDNFKKPPRANSVPSSLSMCDDSQS